MRRTTAVILMICGLYTAVAAQNRFVFPTEVEPIVTTTWGQEYPYNRKCPTVMIDSVEKHVYAGCGPLVMSQVIRSLKYPSRSKLGHRYDWTMMFSQASDTATIAQQDAVAQLIRDCGTAAGTDYHATASSTKLNSVVLGMKKYFGYNRYMHIEDRARYGGTKGSEEWKTLIYNELKAGRPVIIRGEKGPRNAHVFIIDGCRDSTVHVNWGWNGRRNGYYDPDSLYGFRSNQRMVTGVAPDGYRPLIKTISLNRPGTLAQNITEGDWMTLRHLKITGQVNRDDINLLRRLAGGGPKGARRGNLFTIDMTESVILTLPDSAFAGCENLTYISLPITLPEISSYAFSGCDKLNEVGIGPLVSVIRRRAFFGCFNLMDIRLPASLRTIEDNAFNSCNALTEVTLPRSVTKVGNGVFAHSKQLSVLRIPKSTGSIGKNITAGTKVKRIVRI